MSATADRRPVLAVFGGSFNPPHLAHAMLPAYLFARGWADAVLVAPCASHALGKALTPFERRLAWCEAAFAGYDGRVWVSEIEAELAQADGGRPSYALRLLAAVAERYPEYRVRLVVGSDITQTGETERWHRWDQIEAEFAPLVVPRAGYEDDADSALGAASAVSLPAVSSTQVRAWLEAPESNAAALDAALGARVAKLVTRAPAGHLWIVGRGNVGAHLGRKIMRADPWFEVEYLSARSLLAGRYDEAPSAPPSGVLILGRDGHLSELARALATAPSSWGLRPETPVLHAAGSLRAELALAPLVEAGHPVGTLHPICSLRSERARSQIEVAGWGIEGHPEARSLATRLAGPGPILELDHLDASGRARYHAACALVANYVAVLREAGRRELAATVQVGGDDDATLAGVTDALLRSAVDNLVALGVPDGVTGPVARGELEVAERHAAALGPEAGELYRQLSARLAALLGR